jgi:hypothetical protein
VGDSGGFGRGGWWGVGVFVRRRRGREGWFWKYRGMLEGVRKGEQIVRQFARSGRGLPRVSSALLLDGLSASHQHAGEQCSSGPGIPRNLPNPSFDVQPSEQARCAMPRKLGERSRTQCRTETERC